MQYAVYIMSNRKYGTLYIGATSNLMGRVWHHKNNVVKGFTNKYRLHRLVYYEITENIESAIVREKQIKAWKRQWKIEIIDRLNPKWVDLYQALAK